VEVRGYVEQLIAGGWLALTADEFPVLRPTPDGLALLRDPDAAGDLRLSRQRKVERAAERPARAAVASWDGVDRDLFEILRALRLRIARERGVPPYVVFHDATLRELARLKPASGEALRHVYGVGARKADDLGDLVLSAIAKHAREAGGPDGVKSSRPGANPL
jgi:ATP-dependent DNA helicase RecQ